MKINDLIKLILSENAQDLEIANTMIDNNIDLRGEIAVILCYVGNLTSDPEQLEKELGFTGNKIIRLWDLYASNKFFKNKQGIEELKKLKDLI